MRECGLSMQRYWGSDDSDLSDDDQAAAKLKEVLQQAKRRRHEAQELNLSTVSAVVSTDESRLTSEDAKSSLVNKFNKRKRKNISTEGDPLLLRGILNHGNEAHSLSGGELLPDVNHHQMQKSANNIFSNSDCAKFSDTTVAPVYGVKDGSTSNSQISLSDVDASNFETRSVSRKKKNKKQSNIKNKFLHSASLIGDLNYSSEGKNLTVPNVMGDNPNVASEANENKRYFENISNTGMFTIIGDTKTKRNETVKRILPEWLAKPTVISVDIDGKKSALSELDYLDDNAKSNLERLKVTNLFPVQVEVVPWLMQSNVKRLCIRPSDICVSAPTGSGKTLAFVLPIIQSLTARVVCQVRALVILPTGDLAVQVYKVFEQFCKGTDLHVALVVGQRSFLQEQNSLVKEGVRGFRSLVDIVVGTPGRMTDHINSTAGFTLQYLKYLVIDEADRMMEEIQQGFLKKVEKAIFSHTSPSECDCASVYHFHEKTSLPPTTPCAYGHISEPVQKLLYSATLSQDPEKLHELSLFQPKLFTSVTRQKSVSGSVETVTEKDIEKYTTPKGLVEEYAICAPSVKPLILSHLIDARKFKRVLCFTKSVESSHRLRLVLENMGDLKVREVSSSLQPVQRKIILKQFASSKLRVLVCTDLMARGMDIENVDCVISYDLPKSIKNYVHRIGRTARAGREGHAITFLEEREVRNFMKILTRGGKEPPRLLEIDFETLKPMEDQYKKALDSVSKIIADEKRKEFLLKQSARSSKTTKNKKFHNSIKKEKKWS